MSLKPRTIDFQETWADLKKTVAGVVALQTVERAVWNRRFSDVYALCVAHPEPLADKLYDETRIFLEEHVGTLLQQVLQDVEKDSADHHDGLLIRYVDAWKKYSRGVDYLNNLYAYLNLQHIKRQKATKLQEKAEVRDKTDYSDQSFVTFHIKRMPQTTISDAEIIYGSPANAWCNENETRQLEVGELGLMVWECVLIRRLGKGLTARIVSALEAARANQLEKDLADVLVSTIKSSVEVQEYRVRSPRSLYQELVLDPYLAAAAEFHAREAARLLQEGDIGHYMKHALEGLEREIELGNRFLDPTSKTAVRKCYEQSAVASHMFELHAHCERLMREATDNSAISEMRCDDLRRMYTLLRPLPQGALRPLIDAAHAQAMTEGQAKLAAPHNKEDAHNHFVHSMLALHEKYSNLFANVFEGAQAFVGALDRACSAVVNTRPGPDQPSRAPELLARYCDGLLRRRGAGERAIDVDEALSAAIIVFKYVDDKDVFQKYYARALARRLIHQMSASMDHEEGMINRLKAACGYDFTNKLHRMFTDITVSTDLNTKFQQYLRAENQTTGAGFTVQVLQAGAWPLGGAMSPLAPPPALERPAQMFETFYRSMFSGRRLAWLHHFCTGDIRTHYTNKQYHISATTPQCALLLSFERVNSIPVKDLREDLQLNGEAWTRHLKPLLDTGLLLAHGEVEDENGEGTLELNLKFTSKRTKLRLTVSNALQTQSSVAGPSTAAAVVDTESVHCDDDRKMYLQAAIVRIMKQRKVLRHTELLQEVCLQARGSFAPTVSMVKKCIEALIDKQYLERSAGTLDTYSYLA